MNRRLTGGVGVVALTGLAVSRTSLEIDSWMSPVFAGRTLGKTLVIGMSDNEAVAWLYEDLFAACLASWSTPAGTNGQPPKAIHGSSN